MNPEIEEMRQTLDMLQRLEEHPEEQSTARLGDFSIWTRCQMPGLFEVAIMHMDGDTVLHMEDKWSEMTAKQAFQCWHAAAMDLQLVDMMLAAIAPVDGEDA